MCLILLLIIFSRLILCYILVKIFIAYHKNMKYPNKKPNPVYTAVILHILYHVVLVSDICRCYSYQNKLT
jgi:hypothetical protein